MICAIPLTATVGSFLQSALGSPLQHWLQQHPLMGWLLHHPWVFLGCLLLSVLLLSGLWSAIARLTENFWLTLMGLPLRLTQIVLHRLLPSLGRPRHPSAPDAVSHQSRLEALLMRLENLQQEQSALTVELRNLLDHHSLPRENLDVSVISSNDSF